jgi:hypothetical protein
MRIELFDNCTCAVLAGRLSGEMTISATQKEKASRFFSAISILRSMLCLHSKTVKSAILEIDFDSLSYFGRVIASGDEALIA